MPERRSQSLQDHDLIIRLDTKVDLLTQKVDDLANSTVTRVDTLEKQVTTNTTIITDIIKSDTDKELRLRFVEKYVWGAIAIIGLINLVGFGFVITKLNN